MRVQGPAFGVIAECLRIQSTARARSRLARLFGANPLLPDARSWYRSALGEIAVAKSLKNLGPGWTVLQAARMDSLNLNIDHVAIGPAGVFTITTKDHTGQRVWVGEDSLLVNGHRTNHIEDVRHAAHSVERLLRSSWDLPITVTPVIALIDPGSLAFGKRRLRDVVVVRSAHLERTITRRRSVLSEASIAIYVGIADDRSSWHPDSRVKDDTLHYEHRFHHLQHQVSNAALRRHLWIVLGALVIGLPILLAAVRAIFAWGA